MLVIVSNKADIFPGYLGVVVEDPSSVVAIVSDQKITSVPSLLVKGSIIILMPVWLVSEVFPETDLLVLLFEGAVLSLFDPR